MISEILGLILKYLNNDEIGRLFRSIDNILIKKEYYSRNSVKYSEIKEEDIVLITILIIDIDEFKLDRFTRLQKLEFGNDFNQPIEKGVLPDSLKKLEFGWNYNQ